MEGVGTLKGTSGRERPARSALALILDTSNDSLSPPIHRRGEGDIVELEGNFRDGNGCLQFEAVVNAVEFSGRQVGVLINGNSEGQTTLVEFLNPFEVGLPHSELALEFDGGVDLAVVPHPFGEVGLHYLLLLKGEGADR